MEVNFKTILLLFWLIFFEIRLLNLFVSSPIVDKIIVNDIKEISLFLETINPEINYRKTAIPAESIKVYIDFASVIKSDLKIKKVNLVLNQLDIKQLKKISLILKPANLTSFINNKIKHGKLNIEL